MGRNMQDDDDDIVPMDTFIANQQTAGKACLAVPTGLRQFKPRKAGNLTLDIIPYVVGESSLKFARKLQHAPPGKRVAIRNYFSHRGIGPARETHVCLAYTMGTKCPVCTERDKVRNSPAPADVANSRAWKESERSIQLVFDHDAPHFGLQLWDESWWNFGRHLIEYIKGARNNEKDRFARFYDRKLGYTLYLGATEVKMDRGNSNTEYHVQRFLEREAPPPAELYDHGYCLDDFIRPIEYADLRDLFMSGASAAPAPYQPPADGPAPAPGGNPYAAYARNGSNPPGTRSEPARSYEDDPPAKPGAKSWDDEDSPPARKPKPAPTDDDAPPAKPARPAKWVPASGDVVKFRYNDEVKTGPIVEVRDDIVRVKCDDREKPYTVDVEEIKLVRVDDTFDAKPAPKPKPAPADDDDAPPPKKKRPAVDEDDPPPARAKKPAADDWDEEEDDGRAFKRGGVKKPAPADEDDAPPPKKRK